MFKKKSLVTFTEVLFFLIFACTAYALDHKKVLVVHSYHPAYQWVKEINKGIKSALKSGHLEIKFFYMDTKRKTSDEWKVRMGQKARQRIGAWKPDVVIIADDNALMFVAQYYKNKAPYFVFCGINGEIEDLGLPCSNITGILERPHFKDSVEFAEQIVRGIRKIAFITDTCSTSIGAVDYVRRENINVMPLGYHLISDFNVWKRRVNQYNLYADALCIYMYHTIKLNESKALSMMPKEVIGWTIDNCTIPTIGFFDFTIEEGLLCGVAESGEEHGYEAGKMAFGLLSGRNISQYPVKQGEKRIKMINLKTAEKLKIQINDKVLKSADKIIY